MDIFASSASSDFVLVKTSSLWVSKVKFLTPAAVSYDLFVRKTFSISATSNEMRDRQRKCSAETFPNFAFFSHF